MRSENLDSSIEKKDLFWHNTLVNLRRSDKDESAVILNIRLLADYTNQTLKHLRLYISKDCDSSFLYSLHITEEHYGRIREDEKLLVDFPAFAQKVVWLFDQCHSFHEHSETKKLFRIILQIGGANAGTLRLVESNAFKELPHLTLQTRAGTDSSIKEFLAFRLQELKINHQDTANKLSMLHNEHQKLQKDLALCQDQAVLTMQQHATSIAKCNAEIESLKQQLETAQHLGRALTEQLAAATTARIQAEERAASAESTASSLGQLKSSLETKLAESTKRAEDAEESAAHAKSTAQQAVQRWEGFELALKQADARAEEWRSVASANESRANHALHEVVDMRNALESISEENRELNRQIQQKEKMLEDLKSRFEALKDEKQRVEKIERDLKQNCVQLEKLLEKSQLEASQAQAELVETKKKVQSNEKMISWLNKQLTAAQLHSPSDSTKMMFPPPTPHQMVSSKNFSARGAGRKEEWMSRSFCPEKMYSDVYPVAPPQPTAVGVGAAWNQSPLSEGIKDVFDKIGTAAPKRSTHVNDAKNSNVSPASVLDQK